MTKKTVSKIRFQLMQDLPGFPAGTVFTLTDYKDKIAFRHPNGIVCVNDTIWTVLVDCQDDPNWLRMVDDE